MQRAHTRIVCSPATRPPASHTPPPPPSPPPPAPENTTDVGGYQDPSFCDPACAGVPFTYPCTVCDWDAGVSFKRGSFFFTAGGWTQVRCACGCVWDWVRCACGCVWDTPLGCVQGALGQREERAHPCAPLPHRALATTAAPPHPCPPSSAHPPTPPTRPPPATCSRACRSPSPCCSTPRTPPTARSWYTSTAPRSSSMISCCTA